MMNDSGDPIGGRAGPAPEAALPPAHILCLAKGFSRIFWGVFFMVALFLCQAVFEVFNAMRVPAYVLGAGLVCWGLFLLRDAGPVSRAWRGRTRLAIGLACLCVYFAPFIAWWKAMPYVNLFLVNVLALLLAGMLILLLANLLAADVFRRFGERGAHVEALVFAFGVVALMIAPFLVGLLFALVAAIRYESTFASEVWPLVLRVPIGFYAVATLPCSLTLVAAWKAKSMCYRRLWESREPPPAAAAAHNAP
jgi:hypothetical protein